MLRPRCQICNKAPNYSQGCAGDAGNVKACGRLPSHSFMLEEEKKKNPQSLSSSPFQRPAGFCCTAAFGITRAGDRQLTSRRSRLLTRKSAASLRAEFTSAGQFHSKVDVESFFFLQNNSIRLTKKKRKKKRKRPCERNY